MLVENFPFSGTLRRTSNELSQQDAPYFITVDDLCSIVCHKINMEKLF